MHPRLGAKARRAGRRLGNEEDTEALWAHRSGSGPAGSERRDPAMPVLGRQGASTRCERPGVAGLEGLKPYVTLVGLKSRQHRLISAATTVNITHNKSAPCIHVPSGVAVCQPKKHGELL